MKIKYILFGYIFLCFFSCDYRKPVEIAENMNDSLANLIQHGLLEGDSAMLLRAIEWSDSLLQTNSTNVVANYQMYHNRAIALMSLGQEEEALLNEEKGVAFLPANSMERLKFGFWKSLLYNNVDSMAFYSDSILSVCNRKLEESFDANTAFLKAQIILYQHGEDAAKDFLNECQSKHPDDAYLTIYLDNWDEYMDAKWE